MKKNIQSILVISLIVFISFSVVTLMLEKQFSDNESKVIEKIETTDKENLIEELQKEYNNEEIVGVLKIEGTSINEIIVQSEDNEFYLNHGIDKKKKRAGSTFLDYRVEINEGRKNLIYSHNSDTVDVPFKELENYYEQDYYKEHQFIKLIDKDSTTKYQIFSVFVETVDWSYMKLEFSDKEWLKHLQKLKENSWYDTGVEINKKDDILILQTCSHHKNYKKLDKKYLLVIAKKIS